MKKINILFLLSLSLFACKKNNKDPGNKDEQKKPNWEIVQNFMQDKSYTLANLNVYSGNFFVNTYGHHSLTSPSTVNEKFQGTLFFQQTDGWYTNQLPNEGVMALKEFNGALYGVRAKVVPRTIYPTYLKYEYSYILFKWENNNYTDVATLEYTLEGHEFEKTTINDFILWVFQGKLYLISSIGKVWAIENNQFVKKYEHASFSMGAMLAIDNKEVTITQVSSKPAGDGTDITVRGHYYNGSQLTSGKAYEFHYQYRNATGEVLGNTDAETYQAVNGNIWGIGYLDNKIKNYDTNEVVSGVSEGKKMVGNPVIRNKGKIYIPLVDAKLECAGLAIFDGKTLKELPFVLPEILEPCSKLIDATEYNGKVYLLLLSRGQYVIVKNI